MTIESDMLDDKPNTLSALMYLFKHHMRNDCQLDKAEVELLDELEDVGFEPIVIEHAFSWLHELALHSKSKSTLPGNTSMRVFSDHEKVYFDNECQDFIMMLDAQSILNPFTREMVIHQVMTLGAERIDVALIKWVTLMVLFNQPDSQGSLVSMERLVLGHSFDRAE